MARPTSATPSSSTKTEYGSTGLARKNTTSWLARLWGRPPRPLAAVRSLQVIVTASLGPRSTIVSGQTSETLHPHGMVQEALRDGEEENERPATLRLRGGVPQAGLGRSSLRLRRGEGPLQVDRRKVRILLRARGLGVTEETGPAKGVVTRCAGSERTLVCLRQGRQARRM